MKIERSAGAKSPPVGDGTATPPVVVFLHGRGSDESSAAMFAAVFEGATLLAPRGMLKEGGGYAWFRNHSPGVADQTSLNDCVNCLENWTDVNVPPDSNLWLCGYSNGAAAAGALLLSKPDLYRGAILISGPFVSERPWPVARLRGLSILMIYGEDDLVIPRHLLTASATYLADLSGARASILAAPGGHDISQSSLIATRKWFAKEVELSRHAAPKSPPPFGDRAMLNLYYSPLACSLSCHIALEEAGIPYETTEINTKTQANLADSYRAINPLGKVPALAIEGRVLTEAAAILSFIADQVPDKSLLPAAGTAARALAHEWLNFLSSTVHIAFRPVFRPERLVEDQGCIEGLRRVGIKAVAEALRQADAKVGKGPYALGHTFSLCDGYLLVFYLWSKRDPFNSNNMPDFPALRSNAKKVLARPTVRRAMAAEGLQIPSL